MERVAQLAPLEDACTIVLLRDGAAGLETLLLERPLNSRSFGGAWVFPGGKVDPGDRINGTGIPLDDLAAAKLAGLRELAEETGQELGQDDLVWLAQWTPMQAIPRRFRTWFMLARAATDTVVLNPREHERYEWLAPAEALARHSNGGMMLIPPTWVTLHDLRTIASVDEALAAAKNSKPVSYNTHLLMPDAGSRHGDSGTDAGGRLGNDSLPDPRGIRPAGVLWAGDEHYPGVDGTNPAPGARHRLTTVSLPWIFERTSNNHEGV